MNQSFNLKTHIRKAKDCMPVTAWDEDTTWDHEYGLGLIVLTEKNFCSGSTCKDLKVCWAANEDGESAFYLPVGHETNVSKLKVQKRFYWLTFFIQFSCLLILHALL